MIFNQQYDSVQATVNNNASLIDSLLLQVEQLREENLRLEQHLQALGTAESASQSAIEQLRIAIGLIKAVDVTQLTVLESEVQSLFQDMPEVKLIEAVEVIAEEIEEPTPDPEPANDVLEPTEGVKNTISSLIRERMNGNGKNQYDDMTMAELVALTKEKELPISKFDGRGRLSKKALIEQLLRN